MGMFSPDENGWVLPEDLTKTTYKNLPNRLDKQAGNVEKDGHLNAARLMKEAAAVLRHLHQKGVIVLDMNDE